MYLPRNIIQLFSLHPWCAPQSPPRSFEFFIDLAFSPLAVSHHCIVPIRSSKPILGPILSPWPANESAHPFGPILTFCSHVLCALTFYSLLLRSQCFSASILNDPCTPII